MSAPSVRTGHRYVLLALAAAALLAGLDAALLLLGLPTPVTTERLPEVHGIVLVLGFVGTVIALERAVALRRAWAFAAPALLGLGAVVTLSPAPLVVGAWMFVAGGAALIAVYAALLQRQESVSLLLQAGGGVLATGAAILWAGGIAITWSLPWLVGFLVLTIGGERIELARVGALSPRSESGAAWLGCALVAGVVLTLVWPTVGYLVVGGTLVALCGWLVQHDVARQMLNSQGLPRFVAVCLLAGYAWLTVAGGIWIVAGHATSGGAYDAVVHAVFLGFVLSMIMAHAPVILPAVLRRPLPYHSVMYGAVVLLHASLLVRLLAGDARGLRWAWQVGGALNVAALLMFAATAVTCSILASRRARATAPVPATQPAVDAVHAVDAQ